MVFKVARLQFHIEAYTGKDKHEGGHPFKKGSGRYKRKQQGCPTTQGTTMDKKNNSRDHNARKENNNG